MRVTAARLTEHGQPLQVEEVDLAEPGPQEVIMDVAFSGVNPIDLYAAQGRVAPDAPLPRTLGTEGAGMADGRRVVARGHGIGTARDGLWASAAVVPRDALVDVPDGVELPEAAAMGVAGVTAWRAVAELAQVKADDTVLVLGAAIEALEPHGRLVLFGTSAGPDGQVPLQSLYRKGITVTGYAGLLESDEVMSAAIGEALRAVAAGQLFVPVDETVPLAQVNEAFARITGRQSRGKIVLDTTG